MSTLLLSGCAILEGSKLVLLRKEGKDFWELPGGIVSTKKDIEQAAVEKTQSQIGLEPQVVQQFTILEYQKDGDNVEAYIFECTLDDPDKAFVRGENVDEVKWFDIKELGKESTGDDVKVVLEELQS